MGVFIFRRSVRGAVYSAFAILLSGLGWSTLHAQTITVTANQTAAQVAQALTGPGVTVTNATLTCPTNASGTYTIGPNPGNFGIDSGLILTSGRAIGNATNPGTNSPPSTLFATTSN